MKKLIALSIVLLSISGSSFACPFHHIRKDVKVGVVKTGHFFYKVGKYIVT